MEDLIKDFGTCIKLYIGKETITDPYEKTVEVTLSNPIPMKAIVVDLVASQIQWKLPGVKTSKAKELILDKSNLSLVLKSQKFEIEREFYKGWKENNKLQYREEGNTIRLYIYTV